MKIKELKAQGFTVYRLALRWLIHGYIPQEKMRYIAWKWPRGGRIEMVGTYTIKEACIFLRSAGRPKMVEGREGMSALHPEKGRVDIDDGTYTSKKGIKVTVRRVPHPGCPYASKMVEIDYATGMTVFYPDVARCTKKAQGRFLNFLKDQRGRKPQKAKKKTPALSE